MGLRGPHTRPTILKQLAGNPGRRPLNENEPKPPNEMPEMPEHLDEIAKREWNRVGPLLHKIGVLTMVDGPALAAYCMAYSRWVQAEKAIQEHGLVQQGEKGVGHSVWVAVSNRAIGIMHRFMMEFGMTPSARTRIKAEIPTAEKTELDSFLEVG